MVNEKLKYVIILFVSVVALSSCIKKKDIQPDNNVDEEQVQENPFLDTEDEYKGKVMADLLFPGGQKIAFDYTKSLYTPVIIKKDENNQVKHAIQMTFSEEIEGRIYTFIFNGTIRGIGEYHLKKTGKYGVDVSLSITSKAPENVSIPYLSTDDFTLTISAFNEEHIEGTFSGTLAKKIEKDSITIQNGVLDIDVVQQP